MVRSWTWALVLGLLVSLIPQNAKAGDTPAEILTELLQLSRELDLPLPPQGAKLVRYEYGAERAANGVDRPIFSLGFLIKTGGEKKKLTVLNQTSGAEDWQPPSWSVVEPTSLTLNQIYGFSPTVLFAVQCQALGWQELAAALLVKQNQADFISARKQLIDVAWEYWTFQLTRPSIDRKPIAAMLKKIRAVAPEQAAEFRADPLIHSLDLALVPSRARPGSTEALIDALIDANLGDPDFGERLDNPTYRQLVQMGFSAVPTLLGHLDDDRLTRSTTVRDHHGSYGHLRVRDLVADILEKLAGSENTKNWRRESDNYWPSLRRAEKNEVLAWWREAQMIGEEEYLVARAGKSGSGSWYTPLLSKRNQIEVIAHKYPQNLARVYQEILDHRPEIESGGIASAIADSPLSAEEKTRLLLVGAAHKEMSHRLSAIHILERLDHAQFTDLFVRHIDGISPKATNSSRTCSELMPVMLALEADDKPAWQALLRLARRSNASTRLEVFELYSLRWSKSQRLLEFLSAFLGDDTIGELHPKTEWIELSPAFESFKTLEVRNGAAMAFGRILRLETEPDKNWQPAQWAAFREEVRAALQSKGIKPMTEK